jgi:biopolymer transport protein TolR
MAFGSNGRGVKNDINVTPLVDVVLVLLIIFMVITPMLQHGKDLHLPKAQSSERNNKADALTVSLPRDHTLWLESQEVTSDELQARVADAVHMDPQRKVLIRGDESLKVKDVRVALAAAKHAGATAISFAVEGVDQ